MSPTALGHPEPARELAREGGPLAQVGIGQRQPHYAEFARRCPALGFVEVHSENFFADGGAALAVLEGVRATHALSLHGVGLGLGSAVGLDDWHLERLARLVERTQPVRVSDHASFARAALPGGSLVHAADLLPIAFSEASLGVLCANVARVQERLARPILVENLSAYLSLDDPGQMPEVEFFRRLVAQSGCGMLLDVNNLVVNALNAERSREPRGEPLEPLEREARAVRTACAFIDGLPPAAVGEIHLAGYCEAGPLVIDDHGSRVHPPVWRVYRHALERLGCVPTLIEWDTGLPALDVLLQEATTAAALQRDVRALGRAA